ncbi:MAG: O-methyltransferase [Lactobacillus sp.]|jgi:predicted O-methyltransferase YrrM|nr:O-methyltransferase [Lactobacillus sp.]
MRNEMMHRPVIDENILNFLRHQQQPLTGPLKEFEDEVHAQGVPVIPHETVNFFRVLLRILEPQKILEIGTAVGFSAIMMALSTPATTKITTIDRYDEMIQAAQANFKRFELTQRIELLQGDAVDILPTLQPTYDFIFMDSAKSKYVTFLPRCLELLSDRGILLIDDIFQGGTVLQPLSTIKHRNHGIHKNLNKLFETVFNDPALISSVLPLGDGLLLVTKK